MSDPIEFEVEPDDPSRPGQINLRIVTPQDHARYVDRVFTAVAFSLYSFGYLVWVEGSDLPILISRGVRRLSACRSDHRARANP